MRRIALVVLLAACFTDGSAPDGGSDASVQDGGVGAIFATSCAIATCHVGKDAPLKLDLSPGLYESNLVGVPAAEVLDTFRVLPGSATDTRSYLLCKIDPECTVVGDHMPLDGGLPSDQIAAIRAWVASLPPGDASVPSTGLDATPPVFSGAKTATGGPSSITLSWAAATDDVTAQAEIEYLVYEATAQGAEDFSTPTFVTPPGATSFSIGKLAPQTTRFYVVRARDHAANVDANSIEVTATTPSTTDTTPPVFAGVTNATAKSSGTITLAWSAATDAVSPSAQISYAVYAAATSGGETFATPSAITVPGATTLDVTDVGGGTKSFFVVRAIDPAGNADANAIEASTTTPVASFSKDILPIFQSTCTTAGCHVGAHPAEGIDLATAPGALSSLVNVQSAQCSTMSVVQPSSPKTSYLLQKLRGWGSCFVGWQMPEQATPLSPAQIDLVSAWIGSGALSN